MNQSESTGLDTAVVYAMFASVLASEPNTQQVECMGLLLEAAGIEGPVDVVTDEALVQRFHDRLVVAVSPLYVPAVESCMADVRQDDAGCLEPGHVDGKCMTEVLASYRTYDFDPFVLKGFGPLIGSMRPDHLIAELAFMAQLRSMQTVAGARGKAAGVFADEFLEHHLCRWVPTLCAFARQRGSDDVYVRLFEAVRRWVELDAG
ncbi:molecular chaperone TorD family protein [Gordonibacter sp.]|uniref:molecular chaperone TorD family protein n=1 Tax=Gordonibacter sp. TaxID=1968902 RepID=UPI002FCA4866